MCLDPYLQPLAIVLQSDLVLCHRHRLTQKLLGDIGVISKVRQPSHVIPEAREIDAAGSHHLDQGATVIGCRVRFWR